MCFSSGSANSKSFRMSEFRQILHLVHLTRGRKSLWNNWWASLTFITKKFLTHIHNQPQDWRIVIYLNSLQFTKSFKVEHSNTLTIKYLNCEIYGIWHPWIDYKSTIKIFSKFYRRSCGGNIWQIRLNESNFNVT